MKIIAHRGAWCGSNERDIPSCPKNSLVAFKIAVQCGFGIETDFRDICGKVVISHNPPEPNALSAEDFFKLLQPGQIVAVNIKSDGLATELFYLWKKFAPEVRPFAFDMSVPDTLGYVNNSFPFLERQSEYEKDIVWPQAAGFWVDGFHSTWFNESFLINLLKKRKYICIVSPELHGRDETNCWDIVYNLAIKGYSEKLYLCTDKPFSAIKRFGGIK